MGSFSEFIVWLGVIFPLVFSAGPGNILCAISGASNGFKQSIPFILGLNLVYTLYSLVAGFGMASIVYQYPAVFNILQLIGVVYIIWLGYKFFSKKIVGKKDSVKQLHFIDGIISQSLNIKGMAIVLTMYSHFLDTEQSLYYEVLSLSFAFLLINLFTHFSWAYGGQWMTRVLTSDKAVKIQNKIYGSMLLLVAVWLLYQTNIFK